MDERILLGVLAVGTGVLVGIAIFVPFVFFSYRRRGGLSFWRFVGWAAFLVYFWAIWAYTLLPLPDPATMQCAGVSLNPLQFIDDIRGAIGRPGNTLTDPATMQLALNVLLFVPLGFFLRVLGGRGLLVALLVGFGLSAFIETTQLTGVWGIYPCAYRVFDVDDLLTNTTGAGLGSLLALVLPARMRTSKPVADLDAPTPVTRWRRLLAMLCDLTGALVVQTAVSLGVQLWLQYVADDRAAVLDGRIAAWSGIAVAAAIWLITILVSGQSIGDVAVELRYTGGPVPEPLARLLRFAGGVGGFMLLRMLPVPWDLLSLAFAIVALVLVFTTRSARGLPGVLSGQQLVDSRSLSPRTRVPRRPEPPRRDSESAG